MACLTVTDKKLCSNVSEITLEPKDSAGQMERVVSLDTTTICDHNVFEDLIYLFKNTKSLPITFHHKIHLFLFIPDIIIIFSHLQLKIYFIYLSS
tara:strand:- start:19 stop:303 length:285 start_codon:yes stop_codon:yes gene_type:complete